MLLTMRRTEEGDRKRVKEEPREYEKQQEGLEESILERLSECTVTPEPEEGRRRGHKKRTYSRQFGVTPDSEYVDITQVQQLLLDSAGSSGKSASARNRPPQQQQQQHCQPHSEPPPPSRPLISRPHSQPSCSTDRYHHLQEPKPRMLAEGLPALPHLQPPAPQTGGHSPNVEELFALWFGSPSANAGWCHPRSPFGPYSPSEGNPTAPSEGDTTAVSFQHSSTTAHYTLPT